MHVMDAICLTLLIAQLPGEAPDTRHFMSPLRETISRYRAAEAPAVVEWLESIRREGAADWSPVQRRILRISSDNRAGSLQFEQRRRDAKNSEMLFLINSRYAALLTRQLGMSTWLLSTVTPLPIVTRLTGELTPLEWDNSLRLAPYRVPMMPISLPGLIDQPEAVKSVTNDEHSGLRLDFVVPERETGDKVVPKFAEVRGVLHVDKQTGFISSYEVERLNLEGALGAPGATQRGTKKFRMLHGRMLVESETARVTPANHEPPFDMLIEYKWQHESLPETDFTLSAFGLPEPFGIEWEKPTPWWLYLICGGLGIIVLLAVGHRLRKAGWLGQAAA